MKPLATILLALPLAFAGCESGTEPSAPAAEETANGAARAEASAPDPATPVAESAVPGRSSDPADARPPLAEASVAPESAQGAAHVVQRYFALIEQGRHGEAWRLWSDGGRASGMSQSAFAASFDGFREYHARVGPPGNIEGAAGSLYVTVPVQVYGRLSDGRPFEMEGPVTLRRANDVPGSTAEQRRWRLVRSGLPPGP